jgi:hypothetical protein
VRQLRRWGRSIQFASIHSPCVTSLKVYLLPHFSVIYLSNFPEASTIHISTHPRSIAKEGAGGARSPSANDFPKYVTPNYTCAQAAELVVTHRSSGKAKKTSRRASGTRDSCQSSSTINRGTGSAPAPGDPGASDLCGTAGLERHCPIESCPKKSINSGSGREFIRHIYDCHRAQFSCSTSWCVFFAEGNERICPSCYDQHPRLKEARVSSKKMDHNRTVVLQGSEPPPPPYKRISAGGPSDKGYVLPLQLLGMNS